MADQTSIRASCMCRAATHTFTAPTSSLPLPAHLCSCNISRRISGALLTSYVRFPDGSKPDVSSLKAYRSSDILRRHFCPTCGTQMYLEYADDGHFEVATGCLERTEGVVEFTGHCWIESAPDGGAADLVPSVGGRTLDRFLREPGTSSKAPVGWRGEAAGADAQPQHQQQEEDKDELYAHCHCGGVKLWISRPGEESTRTVRNAAFPDLLIPESSGASRANPANDPWWAPRAGKFLAGTCACTSCRTSSGFEVTWWSFVPVALISVDDGKGGRAPFRRQPYWGTMAAYRSSDDVTRTFCSDCGCTFFWDGDERPMLVDLAVGTLDAPGGKVRAEDWLFYRYTRVSYTEDALHRPLIRGLEAGLKAFHAATKGGAP